MIASIVGPFWKRLQEYIVRYRFEIASMYSPLSNRDWKHIRSPLLSWLQAYLVPDIIIIKPYNYYLQPYVVHPFISIKMVVLCQKWNLWKDRSGLATYEFDQFLYPTDERIFRADFSLIFDFLTLIFTFISLSLVTRSLYRAQKLRYNFQKWHLQKFGKDSSAADASEFIDGWYIIIFISDLAVIIGTILKVWTSSRISDKTVLGWRSDKSICWSWCFPKLLRISWYWVPFMLLWNTSLSRLLSRIQYSRLDNQFCNAKCFEISFVCPNTLYWLCFVWLVGIGPIQWQV